MGAVSVNKVAALRVRDVMVKDVAYVSVPGTRTVSYTHLTLPTKA